MLKPYADKAQLNLKKVLGQVKLIQVMLEEGKYCMDIAQQVNAAIGLLKKTNDLILESHLNTCAAAKLNSKQRNVREEFVQELIRNFRVTGN